jgi:hypothetical protein
MTAIGPIEQLHGSESAHAAEVDSQSGARAICAVKTQISSSPSTTPLGSTP